MSVLIKVWKKWSTIYRSDGEENIKSICVEISESRIHRVFEGAPGQYPVKTPLRYIWWHTNFVRQFLFEIWVTEVQQMHAWKSALYNAQQPGHATRVAERERAWCWSLSLVTVGSRDQDIFAHAQLLLSKWLPYTEWIILRWFCCFLLEVSKTCIYY